MPAGCSTTSKKAPVSWRARADLIGGSCWRLRKRESHFQEGPESDPGVSSRPERRRGQSRASIEEVVSPQEWQPPPQRRKRFNSTNVPTARTHSGLQPTRTELASILALQSATCAFPSSSKSDQTSRMLRRPSQGGRRRYPALRENGC